METILKYLADVRIVMAIAALVVLLVIWFIVQKIKSNRCKKQLEEYEKRYNDIKSIPLSFKMNKAVAISRVDPQVAKKVSERRSDFDNALSNLKAISQQLADTEDDILAGKNKKAKTDLADLDAMVSLGEKQVHSLDEFLNVVLEKENSQRSEVNELKNKFRDLKAQAQEKEAALSYVWPNIQQNIADTESSFSAFEEWMYGSEIEKANNELDTIKTSMTKLEGMINDLPSLLDDARGVVPKMLEVIGQDFQAAREKGVYLKHLQVEKNVSVINDGLNHDLEELKNGNTENVRSHLDDYKTRLSQIDTSIKKETESFDKLGVLAKETAELYAETVENQKYSHERYEKDHERFGLASLDERLQKADNEIKAMEARYPRVYAQYKENSNPSSSIMASMKEVNSELSAVNADLKDIRATLENAAGDEGRARKQLVKLQIIMSQMQVKIRKYKLPSISNQYEDDMNKANEYIHSLDSLVNATPLNVQLLNSTLKEAIDFIYKLYQNVNNVVATVIMVENTIVFGNRYRSTYADIDSELTRSELCFRNGEYTQALQIAIATIEKIHPGNYENMIKENAKSAA